MALRSNTSLQAARSFHNSWHSCAGRPAAAVATSRHSLHSSCHRQTPHAFPLLGTAVHISRPPGHNPGCCPAARVAAATVAAPVTQGSDRSCTSHTATAVFSPSIKCSPRCSRSVKCYSTPSFSQPSGNPQHISWLHDVQTWCPTAPNTNTSSSSSTNNNNHVGSTNGTGSSGSASNIVDASSCNGAAGYHPPSFQQLSEAELRGTSSTFDAIVVLAGGLTPDGGLPEWVHRRLDVARDLHLMHGKRPAILCAGGGTPHKPAVVASNGHIIHESTSCATYLMATGVQPDMIYKEVSSFDTVGNAYFSLAIHAIPAGWRRLAVVTSNFHMPRSRALFADIYRLAGQSVYNDPHWFSLTFLSASDEGVFDAHVYDARLGKEAGGLAHWEGVAAGLSSWPAFHTWFYHEHLCYAVPRQHEFGKRTIQDQRLLDSY